MKTKNIFRKHDRPVLTVVIPVYNAVETLESLVNELVEQLRDIYFQIILVNDGSHDSTHDICEKLVNVHPGHILYITLSRNFGEHNAVMAGLNHAEGRYVVVMDDDFQNPPGEVLRLLNEAIRGNHDIVYTRYARKKHGLFRNMGSRFTNFIARILLGLPKGIYLSSFKCMSGFLVGEVIKYKGPFPYIDGLALRVTRNIGVVQTKHEGSRKNRSTYTFGRLVRLWLNMFLNFSILPLRISTLLGCFFSIVGLAGCVFVIGEKLMYPETPVGWASMIIAVMMFCGVQLLMLGLIGEYIGQLMLNSNSTPQYSVRGVYREPAEHSLTERKYAAK